ncbi:MAG: YafY family transcriptional regulator [Cyclobacteriaceae bacterium]|nr:YafY family transcriptional regulator [Cyclobacteriaceae bacterium HetDA_MAG_MS6]
MNRIDRLSAILIQLQSKRRVMLSELEERFDLSRRTIFRDVRALIDSGVPIGGNAGEGYFIVEGYHLPPVVFSKEEASALLLGGKLIEHNADANTSLSFQNALYKIKSVLHYADQDFLDNLEKSISIVPSPSVRAQGFPDSHITEIQFAIASKRTIQLAYYSNYNGETTDREVEPLGLVYYSSRWHLIGFCHLRQDLRDFRTDRIRSLQITPNSFELDRHPYYMDFLQETLLGTDAKEAIIQFRKNVYRFISDQKFYYGFAEETDQGEWVEMKFYTPHFDFFGRWLLTFSSAVRVIHPPQLKEIMLSFSKELLEHHSKSS